MLPKHTETARERSKSSRDALPRQDGVYVVRSRFTS